MSMEEVRLNAPRRPHEAGEQRRGEQREPRAPTEVAEHAVPERQPVPAELLGSHDLDVDAAPPDVLDGVGDEAADDVARKARIGRRENGDSDADL
jgi:hypothetical protein